jgi:hypothetical protein
MSWVNPYASIEKRTFESALLHLLETEYGLLGGRRILRLLVEDVLTLQEEFYPPLEQVGSGDLIWTCTADEGKKAEPGKRTEEYKTVTVKLPFVTQADLRTRTEGKTPKGKTRLVAKERDKQRLARLAQAAAEQGGLLTIADPSIRCYQLTRPKTPNPRNSCKRLRKSSDRHPRTGSELASDSPLSIQGGPETSEVCPSELRETLS